MVQTGCRMILLRPLPACAPAGGGRGRFSRLLPLCGNLPAFCEHASLDPSLSLFVFFLLLLILYEFASFLYNLPLPCPPWNTRSLTLEAE